MDEPRDYHTKWSKSKRERQMLYDITYMGIQKVLQINLFMEEKQTHMEKIIMAVKREKLGRDN